MASSQRHIGGTDPVYADAFTSGQDIIVYTPTSQATSGVDCECITKPDTVDWGYVVVNEQALYNSNTSVDFELHKSEEDSLVFKILELGGIIINKPGLVQIAAGKETTESQIQKQ